MRKSGFFITTISFLFIISCLPEPLEVKNIPEVQSEIVIASQFIPDGSLLVFVTRTFGALEAGADSDPETLWNQIAVDDATVSLKGPEDDYMLNQITGGVYGGIEVDFREGKEYTLVVESPTLGSARAVTTVMPRLKFDRIRAGLHLTEFNDTLAEISYSVRDPVGPNWYMINVQAVELSDIINDVINPRSFTKLFDDSGFNERSVSERFRVYPRDFAPGDTIAVSLSNISREYFDFLEMRMDNRYSFLEFISEPVNYPTNVEGGKGFFNLYLPDFRFFVFE